MTSNKANTRCRSLNKSTKRKYFRATVLFAGNELGRASSRSIGLRLRTGARACNLELYKLRKVQTKCLCCSQEKQRRCNQEFFRVFFRSKVVYKKSRDAVVPEVVSN
ncbi:hypothetical protein A4A49_31193 [Nicotiana attenuata]|uniref:Uncharacterized protein n=1 Tax=Nicotiana attenuata TaxID=49451 RepID=A0A314LG69_NICAT|nr:hypothetical protein A4A49_31193 [Nicotiana attenuata]